MKNHPWEYMNKFPYEYSEKEIDLFTTLDMLDHMESKSMVPPLLYTEAAVKCFIEDRNDISATSLRRCLNHLNQGKHRMTPEFDALIELEEI